MTRKKLKRESRVSLGLCSKNALSANAPSDSGGWIIIGQFKIHFRLVVERDHEDFATGKWRK